MKNWLHFMKFDEKVDNIKCRYFLDLMHIWSRFGCLLLRPFLILKYFFLKEGYTDFLKSHLEYFFLLLRLTTTAGATDNSRQPLQEVTAATAVTTATTVTWRGWARRWDKTREPRRWQVAVFKVAGEVSQQEPGRDERILLFSLTIV